jgi:predicted RNA binding protein YcfA (HicA-like mRNA interferase family)
MGHLPVVSGKELVRALSKLGYELDHQTGSHIILRNAHPPHRRLTVPNHRTIAKGTLRQIMREAGIGIEDLADLLA